MDTVLVDTSVWINFFKGIETEASLYLKNNISNSLFATCPVIVQEVLQGLVSDKQVKTVNTYFHNLLRFTGSPYDFAEDAAKLYRDLRKAGITIRKPNDCLIATYALKYEVSVLHDDKDFKFIAKHSSLKTISFS